MADLVGGTLPMLYTAVAGAYPFIQKGQVQAIAVSSRQRLASLPDVPTVAESGAPGFESSSWIGILAPKGTPQPIVDKLQRTRWSASRRRASASPRWAFPPRATRRPSSGRKSRPICNAMARSCGRRRYGWTSQWGGRSV